FMTEVHLFSIETAAMLNVPPRDKCIAGAPRCRGKCRGRAEHLPFGHDVGISVKTAIALRVLRGRLWSRSIRRAWPKTSGQARLREGESPPFFFFKKQPCVAAGK